MTDMKRSQFTDEQIIGFLRQAEAGMPVKDLCRKEGFSDVTFCKWRTKCGGVEASDARRLRKFEAENARLKTLLAEAQLDLSGVTLLRRMQRRLNGGGRSLRRTLLCANHPEKLVPTVISDWEERTKSASSGARARLPGIRDKFRECFWAMRRRPSALSVCAQRISHASHSRPPLEPGKSLHQCREISARIATPAKVVNYG
jgi:putative transposase